jgi:Ser/Thr protein kinase RdoA (MazF antagonist)
MTPALVYTRNGSSYYQDPSGAFWRMFHFIETGSVFDVITGADHAYQVGRGLGMFQALVSDLSPGLLHDTLPGFHHTPRYLAEYDEALAADAGGRAAEIRAEAEFVARHRHLAGLLIDFMKNGAVPLRVVHNDPKVNNVMIHSATREALCMLDLDTVKPGIVHFDFGDCVRSAANPAGEDALDPDSVSIDLPLFEAIAKGYLSEAGGFLTEKEIELLPLSVKVITFELGLRFLADHLRGNTYFRINYPGHNLHRARVQFRLLETIEAEEERMASFIALQARQ